MWQEGCWAYRGGSLTVFLQWSFWGKGPMIHNYLELVVRGSIVEDAGGGSLLSGLRNTMA